MTTMTNQQHIEGWYREWRECPGAHWGDKIDWKTADEIARRLDEASMPEPESCDKAPKGWYCTREKGHDGPCAAQSNLFD